MLDPNEKSKISNKARRQFLKGLCASTLAGGVGSVVTTSAQADVTVQEPANVKTSGYHETQHIRDYYDSL